MDEQKLELVIGAIAYLAGHKPHALTQEILPVSEALRKILELQPLIPDGDTLAKVWIEVFHETLVEAALVCADLTQFPEARDVPEVRYALVAEIVANDNRTPAELIVVAVERVVAVWKWKDLPSSED